LTPVMEQEDQDFIQTWLQRHVEYTGSTVAQMVLENWYDYMPRFIKVLPLEYKRVLQERKLQEVDQQLALIRDEAMLGVAY
jgi:glutamate synthase (NADPH/NADH) large chain